MQRKRKERLTPRHRFRQLEPSWLRSGHTTSLLASVTEKEEVREARGGMLAGLLQAPRHEGHGGRRGGWAAAGGCWGLLLLLLLGQARKHASQLASKQASKQASQPGR